MGEVESKPIDSLIFQHLQKSFLSYTECPVNVGPTLADFLSRFPRSKIDGTNFY